MTKKQKVVTKMRKIQDLGDIARMNAELMEQVANDPDLQSAQKMASFAQGVRSALAIRSEQRQTAIAMARIGIKPEAGINRLTLDVEEK